MVIDYSADNQFLTGPVDPVILVLFNKHVKIWHAFVEEIIGVDGRAYDANRFHEFAKFILANADAKLIKSITTHLPENVLIMKTIFIEFEARRSAIAAPVAGRTAEQLAAAFQSLDYDIRGKWVEVDRNLVVFGDPAEEKAEFNPSDYPSYALAVRAGATPDEVLLLDGALDVDDYRNKLATVLANKSTTKLADVNQLACMCFLFHYFLFFIFHLYRKVAQGYVIKLCVLCIVLFCLCV